MLKDQGKPDPSEIEIFRAIQEMRKLEEAAAAESKRARRQVQRRREHEKHNKQYFPSEKERKNTAPVTTNASILIQAAVEEISDTGFSPTSEEAVLVPRVIRKLKVERT